MTAGAAAMPTASSDGDEGAETKNNIDIITEISYNKYVHREEGGRKMTRIKRYGIIISCVCLLLAILIAASIFVFLKITEGEIYEQDGLRQNTRVYMTDVYYVDHTVHFTTVNRSHKSVSGSSWPHVQKKVNGGWRDVTLHDDLEKKQMAKPFSARESICWILPELRGSEALIGEYRLINSGNNNTYVVGYFNVTAEMLQ